MIDNKIQSELILTINKLPSIIKDKIGQVKATAYKILEQGFVELEKDALETINKINEDMNLFSLRKSENY